MDNLRHFWVVLDNILDTGMKANIDHIEYKKYENFSNK